MTTNQMTVKNSNNLKRFAKEILLKNDIKVSMVNMNLLECSIGYEIEYVMILDTKTNKQYQVYNNNKVNEYIEPSKVVTAIRDLRTVEAVEAVEEIQVKTKEKSGLSCVMNNQKTIKTVDFTTNCPKRQENKPCKYCYVEAKRNIGFNAKKVIDNINYNGEILKMNQKTIDKLNSTGGIRLFSFGDYMSMHDNDIKLFMDDCRTKKLFVKVVTKQLEFIDKFYKKYEDVFSVIHISIDNIENGVDIPTALNYRKQFKKVIIRSVILKISDIEALEPISDILTFNHENIRHNVPNSINFKLKKELMDEFKETFKNKMCCQTGSCETCSIKCKANL